MVRLTEHESLSRETVRRRLSENDLKPWRKDMWCIPKVDAAYVAAMEDVLDLYNDVSDPDHPVVCFDESPVQLIGEIRAPFPAKPGQPRRFDYEYRRKRHRQPLRLPRCPSGLAQGQGHRTPHSGRFRRLHAGSQ